MNGPVMGDMGNQYEISSAVYKILNCTQYKIFLVDGSSQLPHELIPLVDARGTVDSSIPREFVGHVVLVKSELRENAQTGVEIWNYAGSRIIGTPQLGNGISSINDFVSEVKDFDFILFGDYNRALQFVQRFGNYYNYLLKTDFGTRFTNSANYGILNCTGKTLYQVDDTAIEDVNQSDIIEIPAGEDSPLPLWDQQKFNNANNVKPNVPYVRAYRYSMVATTDGNYKGVMREHIYKWNESINEDGFLYIPYHHMCLFDDKTQAENFVRGYKSVERFHTLKTAAEMEEKLQEKIDESYKKQKRDHRRVIAACCLLLSLNIATKLGEVFQKYLKDKNKPNNKKKR